MSKIFEIRWHGRGGQGAKTAALLFGESAMSTGKYFQAFPEYGPERMGAPVQAFNRLSDSPIILHCGIKEPDVVVVLDPTLLGSQPIMSGLKAEGAIIVNTTMDPKVLYNELGVTTQKVFTVDASGISRAILGRDLPNTPLLGALTKVLGIMTLDDLLSDIKKRLHKKFSDEVVEKNIQSIKKAYEEVQPQSVRSK